MPTSDPVYLPRYMKVMKDQLPCQFLISQSIEVSFRYEMDIQELWKLHDDAMDNFREKIRNIHSITELSPRVTSSLLDLKASIADKMLQDCHFCERRCSIDRKRKETGYCRQDAISRYSSEFLHQGEEPELVPSHTIFLTGCNFSCVYCQNWQISTAPRSGIWILPQELAKRIMVERAYGSRNVNFVTPTPHTHTIMNIINAIRVNIPVVWNSNMYYSKETAKLLEGVVDVYLGDFRYGNDECARKYSNVNDYFAIVTRNFNTAYHSGEILLRHLVLPDHLKCCTTPIINWTERHIPKVRFNLMFQYLPHYRAHEFPDINRGLTQDECQRAVDILKRSGLVDILV